MRVCVCPCFICVFNLQGDNKMIEFYLNAGGANALMKNGKGMSACELALAQKHQQVCTILTVATLH